MRKEKKKEKEERKEIKSSPIAQHSLTEKSEWT
jgi:hypothetical protein